MRIILFLTVLFSALSLTAQQTPFEISKGKKTATYFEAINWYRQLYKKSPIIYMKEMGPTDAGYPLHLVMISSDSHFDPSQWHLQKKVVILINNGIHPGEPDGIDASMMLVRDIMNNKVVLPSNVVLAIIPVYNIGGCLNRNSFSRVNQNGPEEYGFRGNSQNLDLNRDFTKCDSKEARSFAQIFHFLEPDILIDNHVSDGADYQHTMTLITTQYDKLGPVLGKWLKNEFEPLIYDGMKTRGWDLIPYIDFDTGELQKGITMFYDPPRYSSGYAALFNTLSFMPETHMLKPYFDRVKSTYDLLVTFISVCHTVGANLLNERKIALDATLKQQLFPLSWKQDTAHFTEIIFKGYEKDTSQSEATGLTKMYYNRKKPFTASIKYFNVYSPLNEIKKPKAYIIPKGWQAVVDIMMANQIIIQKFSTDTVIPVSFYHIDDYKSLLRPYEKHHRNYAVKVSKMNEAAKVEKGDYIIYMDQPGNRYIIEMLEPTGDDSFFSWNFFDAILQQKEGYSDYRWEELAAVVLKNNPGLQQDLENKKKHDPQFAKNSSAILDYIYKHSSYYEKVHLRYPVLRIETE